MYFVVDKAGVDRARAAGGKAYLADGQTVALESLLAMDEATMLEPSQGWTYRGRETIRREGYIVYAPGDAPPTTGAWWIAGIPVHGYADGQEWFDVDDAAVIVAEDVFDRINPEGPKQREQEATALLAAALPDLRILAEDAGDDHSVGLCNCGLRDTIEGIELFLRTPGAVEREQARQADNARAYAAEARDIVFRALDNARANGSVLVIGDAASVAVDLGSYEPDLEDYDPDALVPHIIAWQALNVPSFSNR